ncbi:hypothetical protein OIE49_26930 [Streptomyces sp. NBC_01788]|uniref:hypothetical protein n=1 Tax=Streptomyces sp. NBC_01788 TaxID=2975940 RepID=UPI002DDAA59D|nr:hypothetical protein [Streptomyces sp. NBC_01788]WSB29239.1 hypothetical protein OIE49_26930 [Streptomyces sp. NBC_01788]
MSAGITKKVGMVAAAALCVLGAGTSAWAGTTSTSLSNGTLYSTVENGRLVSGNSSLFYSSAKYTKTGGSAISAVFAMDASGKIYSSPAFGLSTGQTKTHSFGGLPVPSGCRATGGMSVSGQGTFWAPTLNPC